MIITKYIARKFIIFFLLILIVNLIIWESTEVISLISNVPASHKFEISTILLLAFFKFIQFLPQTLPAFILAATAFTFFNLQNTTELTSIRAAGFSMIKVFSPLIFISFLIGFIYIFLIGPVANKSTNYYNQIYTKYLRSDNFLYATNEELGYWFIRKKSNEKFILKISYINNEKKIFGDINIYILDLDNKFKFHIKSNHAYYFEKKLCLDNAYIIDKNFEQKFERLYCFNLDISYKKIIDNLLSINSLSVYKFPSFLKYLKETGRPYHAYTAKFINLILLPIYLCFMPLFWTPIAATNIRKTKTKYWLYLAFILIISYTSKILFNILIISNDLSPIISSIIMILLNIFIALILFLHYGEMLYKNIFSHFNKNFLFFHHDKSK